MCEHNTSNKHSKDPTHITYFSNEITKDPKKIDNNDLTYRIDQKSKSLKQPSRKHSNDPTNSNRQYNGVQELP